jgi:GR25 family glycosyltransferase involved in LPS biosynthesis
MNTLDSHLDKLLGRNNWKASCINLKVAAQRRNDFNKWANDVGLTFNYFDAVDKNTLTTDDYQQTDVIVNGTFKSAGATACRLSHQRLMEHLLEQYPTIEYFFILEDDCGFKHSNRNELFKFVDSVAEYNTNWDTLLFGYHETGYKQLVQLTPNINYIINSHLAHATIYKRSAMEAVLYFCYQPEFRTLPFDWITDMLRQKKSVTLGPINTIIDQVDSFSFINFNHEGTNKIEIEDLMRCCVQFPVTINGKMTIDINVNTNYGDVIFLPHNTIKSLVQNSRYFKQPFVIVAYDENNTISQDVLEAAENSDKILALYINSPAKTSNKIIDLDIKTHSNIVYWKNKFEGHK